MSNNINLKTKRLVTNAMLAAMCAVLGYLAVDLGNLKVTFESLPILIGAFLFGPVYGACVGAVGTLVYQLVRYGVSVTTVLWMLPYIVAGFLVGIYAKRKDFSLNPRQILVVTFLAELLITLLNTGVLYIDSKIFGYYSPVYIFGSLGMRLVICVVKGIAFGLIIPGIVRAVTKVTGGGKA